jgi:endonuclease III
MTPRKLNKLFDNYEVTPTKLIDFYETMGFNINLHHQISMHRNKAEKISVKSQILYSIYFAIVELKRKDLIDINLLTNTIKKINND